jgi:hypothetical protein
MRNSILTTFIRQDSANKPLLFNALSQIVVKTLFQYTELNKDDLYKNVNKAVNFRVDKNKIESVLEELQQTNNISLNENKYSLSMTYKQKVENCINARDIRFDNAIQKYFSNPPIEPNILKSWFDDMNISFFSEYNNDWLEDFIGRSEKRRSYLTNYNSLSNKKIFDKYNIADNDAKWLFDQYLLFLKSNDPEIGLLMLDYANSLFAAKLISANVFADTSVKEMLQDSVVILDTNILLYLNLEKDIYTESYKSLEDIFILLNIQPIYFHITKEEYSRVISYKIDMLKQTIATFDEDVIKESSDPFLQTSLYRNCSEEEHYEIYYESLREMPRYFYKELGITEYDNREIIDHIENEGNKKILQEKMDEIYFRYRGKHKRENNLNHDAGLVNGLDYLKKERKAWILTRDGTVHAYSVENTRHGDYPIAINLNSIINLLCVNEGGIDIDSSNFGPLFSQFVKKDIMPFIDSFQLEDLTRMSEIEQQVSQLPDQNIIELAKDVNHDRLRGVKDENIALKIHRCIQSYKIEVKDELETVKAALSNSKNEVEKLSNRNETVETNYKSRRKNELENEKIPKLRRKFISRFVLQLVFLIISIMVIYIFIKQNSNNNHYTIIIGLTINVLTGFIFNKYLWPPNFFSLKKKLKKEIEHQVNKDWEELNLNELSR